MAKSSFCQNARKKSLFIILLSSSTGGAAVDLRLCPDRGPRGDPERDVTQPVQGRGLAPEKVLGRQPGPQQGVLRLPLPRAGLLRSHHPRHDRPGKNHSTLPYFSFKCPMFMARIALALYLKSKHTVEGE